MGITRAATTSASIDRTVVPALIEVPGPAKGGRRWELVDMLRGIAVLLVLFRHHDAGGVLQEIGWIGVDLFFVLSGFLVSGLIFDEYRRTGGFDGVRFLIRRGFKIYPSFYALMAVTGRTDPIMNYVAEIFFFQNYHEGLWVHTWSLAVEEHFYLALVFAALLLIKYVKKLRWRTVVGICMLLFLLFLGLRFWTSIQLPFRVRTHFFPTHLRMDSLLAGVLLAAWNRYRPDAFRKVFGADRRLLFTAMLIFLLPLLLADFGSLTLLTIGFTGIYMAAAIAVGMAVTSAASATPGAIHRYVVRPLAWVGGISYTTYLWHLLVLLVLEILSERIGLNGSRIEFVAFVLLSIAVGELTSRLIERPALALRERWYPARGR